jgi:hypothetical protein
VGRYRPQLDEVIVPVAVVAELAETGELPIQRRATATGTVPAVPAQQAYIRFETPPGIIARIDHVIMRPTSGSSVGVFGFGSTLAAPGTLAVKQFMDGRLRERGEAPGCNLGFDTLAAGVAAPSGAWMGSNAVINSQVTVPQLHGAIVGRRSIEDFIEVTWGANNIAVLFSWVWTEFLSTP